MTAQDRKEKATLHKELIDILTNCDEDDEIFLKRLIWANEIINREIEKFTNEEYMKVIMKIERR